MASLGIHNEILKIAQTYGIKLSGVNPYTNLSPQDISNKWETVSQREDTPKTNWTVNNWFPIIILCMDICRAEPSDVPETARRAIWATLDVGSILGKFKQ